MEYDYLYSETPWNPVGGSEEGLRAKIAKILFCFFLFLYLDVLNPLLNPMSRCFLTFLLHCLIEVANFFCMAPPLIHALCFITGILLFAKPLGQHVHDDGEEEEDRCHVHPE